ncbi:MAG: NTPase, partial [Thermoplasmata archaeon]|nr:NTPase [Thermoplasmata archaeon]
MPNNILLTGFPGCGKTTVIMKVLERLEGEPRGFYTEEVREEGHRTGFVIRTLGGRTAALADIGLKSRYMVGKYGVNIENIDRVAVPSISGTGPGITVVIDEIGKMECFSKEFRAAVIDALDGENIVLGTIARRGDRFIEDIKSRKDVTIFEVNQRTRDALPEKILDL